MSGDWSFPLPKPRQCSSRPAPLFSCSLSFPDRAPSRTQLHPQQFPRTQLSESLPHSLFLELSTQDVAGLTLAVKRGHVFMTPTGSAGICCQTRGDGETQA